MTKSEPSRLFSGHCRAALSTQHQQSTGRNQQITCLVCKRTMLLSLSLPYLSLSTLCSMHRLLHVWLLQTQNVVTSSANATNIATALTSLNVCSSWRLRAIPNFLLHLRRFIFQPLRFGWVVFHAPRLVFHRVGPPVPGLTAGQCQVPGRLAPNPPSSPSLA